MSKEAPIQISIQAPDVVDAMKKLAKDCLTAEVRSHVRSVVDQTLERFPEKAYATFLESWNAKHMDARLQEDIHKSLRTCYNKNIDGFSDFIKECVAKTCVEIVNTLPIETVMSKIISDRFVVLIQGIEEMHSQLQTLSNSIEARAKEIDAKLEAAKPEGLA